MPSEFSEKLKRNASATNQRAIAILESRGFRFLVHFGILNAVTRLEAMDRAMAQGRLYEHLYVTYGPFL